MVSIAQNNNEKKSIIYYLTEDAKNPKEINELQYLSEISKVVIVTRNNSFSKPKNFSGKILKLPKQNVLVSKIFFLWTKVCFILSRSVNSLTDIHFPRRNLYTGNSFLRYLLNKIWFLKYSKYFSQILPTYDDLFFAPFKLLFVCNIPRNRPKGLFKRFVVHDSLFLRITEFTLFILAARKYRWTTIGNVKSWDNPFYSHFVSGASGYLTWSRSCWSDVQNYQPIKTTAYHTWGPRPFFNINQSIQKSNLRPKKSITNFVIGYAAAFCDPIMASEEVKSILEIAKNIESSKIGAKINFRPYPILNLNFYKKLKISNVINVVPISGKRTDRYNDGRENIRFGSDMEKMFFLSKCNVFLSIGSSFTFEAALFGLPIIQYYKSNKNRKEYHDHAVFGRIDISDHIQNYLIPNLTIIDCPSSLIEIIKKIKKNPKIIKSNLELIKKIGFLKTKKLIYMSKTKKSKLFT